MQIDKSVWWYWVPAQFNESGLYYRNPYDLCSLVKSLMWGWLLAVVAVTTLCIVAGSVGYLLLGFWCAVLGWYNNPVDALVILVAGGMTNAMLLGVGTLMLYNHYNVGRKLQPYLTRTTSKDKAPGLISTWLKGLKEKMCVLVNYVD